MQRSSGKVYFCQDEQTEKRNAVKRPSLSQQKSVRSDAPMKPYELNVRSTSATSTAIGETTKHEIDNGV